MSRNIYFISHPEVVVSATVPVPEWPLSDVGRARMKTLLGRDWVENISSVYSSTEQKAIDGADLLAIHLGLTVNKLHDLGENDRSSTGFLVPDEFERTADEFFASPTQSVRGWETAVDAQTRIVSAVRTLIEEDNSAGDIAIVSHGAVGTLLYCSLADLPIDRRWDQPGLGGGNYLQLNLSPTETCTWWKPID